MYVLGVSAGNGVMLYPFKKHVRGNIELRNDYTTKGNPDQWSLNFPGTFFSNKLEEIEEPVDLIIGHPKCGNSSTLALSRGKKLKSHKDEPSLELFLASITKYQPKAFLLENLPKLLDSYSMADLSELYPNYLLQAWTGSMFDLGNSQKNRKRLIITGVKKTKSRKAHKVNDALLHKFPVGYPNWAGRLFDDLPDNGDFRPPMGQKIALYGGTSMTYDDIQHLWARLAPDTRIKTPAENFSTAPGVYKDDLYKYPSTIRKSNRCFNPYGLSYTPRERCRLQGIPDSFQILDSGYPDKTLFNKGCITTGSSPCYEVGLWFYKVLKKIYPGLK